MKKYRAHITAGALELPVDITLERRWDTRFGITGKKITLRLPLGAPPEFIRQQLLNLQNWVETQFQQRPVLRDPFIAKPYQTGDILTVGRRQYFLELHHESRATHTARLIGNTILIQLSDKAPELQKTRSIKTLLSRVVAGDFYPEIYQRVHDWNDFTVKQSIKSVNLKYNHSNWGSCSSHGNVNLSTRLLFAPDEVQNYVILHELAHLVELNHSDRFWNLVSQYMPDYQDKEKWLKVNRAKCDF